MKEMLKKIWYTPGVWNLIFVRDRERDCDKRSQMYNVSNMDFLLQVVLSSALGFYFKLFLSNFLNQSNIQLHKPILCQ